MKQYRAIAEYYDPQNERHPILREDVPFFMGQLPKKRQSILEIATGTARAAIPLAQAGHRVVGIDYAPEMLEIARRKRDGVGLTQRELSLVKADALRFTLREKFDWVCVFFNTFLAFTTLDQQDRVLANCLRHLKPGGRVWLDLFNPDHGLLAADMSRGHDPYIFFVPRYDRTVFMTTDIRRDEKVQVQQVTFNYRWFDAHGNEKREKTIFEMTCIFPRELQLLLERNGLRIERLWGNYDGTELKPRSPRMIVRCCRM